MASQSQVDQELEQLKKEVGTSAGQKELEK